MHFSIWEAKAKYLAEKPIQWMAQMVLGWLMASEPVKSIGCACHVALASYEILVPFHRKAQIIQKDALMSLFEQS